MIITQEGMIIRQNVSEISEISRNTQGVKLIRLNDNDKVRDITNVPNEEDENVIEKSVEKIKSAPPIPTVIPASDEDEIEDLDDQEEEFDDLDAEDDIDETPEDENE